MLDYLLGVCVTFVVAENEVRRRVELGQRALILLADIVVDKIASNQDRVGLQFVDTFKNASQERWTTRSDVNVGNLHERLAC